MNYYNEWDPYAAEWLRNLMAAGLIPKGEVDERSIKEVKGSELKGFAQCHFFAGIGGWSRALRLAGLGDDWECWTGSCPCQPFSAGGKQGGIDDERHLWPVWRELIRECSPARVFGEQVSSPLGKVWLAGVRSELEESGYAVGCANLCGPCVSAPHLRARYFFVADSTSERSLSGAQTGVHCGEKGTGSRDVESAGLRGDVVVSVANAHSYHKQWWSGPLQVGWNAIEGVVERRGREYRAQWRIKPELSIVAHGIPGRVGKLCAAGNAIIPELTAEFVQAYLEC